MPPLNFPALVSDLDVFRRVRKTIAQLKNLGDPAKIQVTAALRAAPIYFTDPGLRILADDLNREFSDPSESLALLADQTAGPEIVTVDNLCTLVKTGLIEVRVRAVLTDAKALPADTEIHSTDSLLDPPFRFSTAELAALSTPLNQAFQADRLALTSAEMDRQAPRTVQDLSRLIGSFLP